MTDIVERLTAGNAAVDAQFRIWRERAERAEAEAERLRAALQPFAALEIHPSAPDAGLVVITDVAGGIIDTGRNRMTVCDVRAARRALKPK